MLVMLYTNVLNAKDKTKMYIHVIAFILGLAVSAETSPIIVAVFELIQEMH